MHTFYTIFNRFLSSFSLSCVCVSVDTTHIIIIFLRALSSTPKNKILPPPLWPRAASRSCSRGARRSVHVH